LRSSVGDATFCGVMVGTGETYLPAFVLAAGLGEFIAGLVASLNGTPLDKATVYILKPGVRQITFDNYITLVTTDADGRFSDNPIWTGMRYFFRREVETDLGKGGPTLRFSTSNGSLNIRQR
jgi:hypothetical protein